MNTDRLCIDLFASDFFHRLRDHIVHAELFDKYTRNRCSFFSPFILITIDDKVSISENGLLFV